MRLRPRFHPILVNALLVGALLFSAAELISPTKYRVGAGVLEVTVTPSIPGGRMRLPLGPFGELTWKTHSAPLDVEANFILSRNADTLPSAGEFDSLPVALLRHKLPWLLVVAVTAGSLIGEGSRRSRVLVGSLGAATILVVGVGAGALAAATFDGDALADPRYRGPIEDAPRVLALIKEIRQDLPGTRRNITRVVGGLQRLHADVLARRTVPRADTVKLLVISDIHNNPLGLLMARDLVEQFNVDGILNAGDFTDRGTASEGELFASLGRFGVPHIVAPGNHEDEAAIAAVERLPRTQVFDRARGCDAVGIGEEPCEAGVPAPEVSAEVSGLTIVGVADPNATGVASDPFNEQADALVPVYCLALERYAAEASAAVVLVHDRRVGQCAAERAVTEGRALVFVHGHDHQQRFEVDGAVVTVDPGTSGANGPKSSTEGDYGFALVELDPSTGVATSVCMFTFEAPGRPTEISCHLLDSPPNEGTEATLNDGTGTPNDGTATPIPAPISSP